MSQKIVGILGICFFLTLVGLAFLHTGQTKQGAGNTVKVITSFYPLYYFATEIGGQKASVTNITPAGAEPHEYEPSAQDSMLIEKSDMLILNGVVEAWGAKIKRNLQHSPVEIVTAGQGLFSGNVTQGTKTVIDPHIWLDPQLAQKEADAITAAYLKKDPANAAYYQANNTRLQAKLDQLDKEYKKDLKQCQTRDIVTSHAAFGYLARAYGLTQISVAGLSPDAEPSVQQLADVAAYVKEHQVKVIFFESLVSPKLSETIARETGTKTLVLDPLEGIAQDDINKGKNYMTVMEGNLKNLESALQCNI